jgi:hypothetical protein
MHEMNEHASKAKEHLLECLVSIILVDSMI